MGPPYTARFRGGEGGWTGTTPLRNGSIFGALTKGTRNSIIRVYSPRNWFTANSIIIIRLPITAVFARTPNVIFVFFFLEYRRDDVHGARTFRSCNRPLPRTFYVLRPDFYRFLLPIPRAPTLVRSIHPTTTTTTTTTKTLFVKIRNLDRIIPADRRKPAPTKINAARARIRFYRKTKKHRSRRFIRVRRPPRSGFKTRGKRSGTLWTHETVIVFRNIRFYGRSVFM